MQPPDKILKGRFVIRQSLGDGSVLVYLAEDQERPGQLFAIKQTRLPAEEAASRDTVEKAAVRLCSLTHENLPRFDTCWEEDGQCFLVMEHVSGQSLEELDSETATLDILKWGCQMLGALRYLHDQGLSHGNLQPDNIVHTPPGRIVLFGFGLAQTIDPTGTMGVLRCEIAAGFSAPERYLTPGQVDVRSDLYAVGAILYHLLSGVPPPEASTRYLSVVGGNSDPLVPLRQKKPQVPIEVEKVIKQLLAVRLEDRFASARLAMQALQAAAGLKPAESPDDRSADRLPSVSQPVRTVTDDPAVPRLKVKRVVVPQHGETPVPTAAPLPVGSIEVMLTPSSFRTTAEKASALADQYMPPPMVRPDIREQEGEHQRLIDSDETVQFTLGYLAATLLGWALGLFITVVVVGPKLEPSLWLCAALQGAVVGTAQWVPLSRYAQGGGGWIVAATLGIALYCGLENAPYLANLTPYPVRYLVAIGAGILLGVFEFAALQPQLQSAGRWILATTIGLLASAQVFRYHDVVVNTGTYVTHHLGWQDLLLAFQMCLVASLPVGLMLGIMQAVAFCHVGRSVRSS